MTVPLVDHVTVVIAGMTDAMIAETIVEMADGMTSETGAMIDGMIGATIAETTLEMTDGTSDGMTDATDAMIDAMTSGPGDKNV